MLDLLRSFCHRYLLDTSLSIEILFSIPSKSIELLFLYIYICIYLRSDLILLKLKYLNLSLSSLSIQTTYFHQKPSSTQDFSLIQASIPWLVFYIFPRPTKQPILQKSISEFSLMSKQTQP